MSFDDKLSLHQALRDNRPTAKEVQDIINSHPKSASLRDADANIPIHIAILNGQSFEVIRILVNSYPEGLMIGGTTDGVLPLHLAILSNLDSEIVLYLAACCPDSLHVQDRYGYLPINRARVKSKYIDIIPTLKELHAKKLTATSSTAVSDYPLHKALSENKIPVEVVKDIMEKWPTSITEWDGEGNLPIHTAILNGQSIEIIRVLVDNYPEGLMVGGTTDGVLPIHLAILSDANSNTVLYLANRCPDSLRVQDKFGYLPVHRARVKSKYSEIIASLLDLYSDGVNAGEQDSSRTLFRVVDGNDFFW